MTLKRCFNGPRKMSNNCPEGQVSHQPQISLLESGKYQLKRETGEMFAEALDVGVDWMVSGDERKNVIRWIKKMIDWLWERSAEENGRSIRSSQNRETMDGGVLKRVGL